MTPTATSAALVDAFNLGRKAGLLEPEPEPLRQRLEELA